MGCDIHLALERGIFKPDAATVAARVYALALAKQLTSHEAAQEEADAERNAEQLASECGQADWAHLMQTEEEEQPPALLLPPELWERIARTCPVTLCMDWVACPFTQLAALPRAAFESKHDGLTALIKSTAEAVSEELKGRLEEEIRSSMPPEIASMPSDEAQQWLSWQVQWGLDEAISQAVSAAVVKEMGEVVTPVFGQELQLERRNYNAFALFGHGSRAQSGLRIKRLGCVRSGRPHPHALAARARHVHEVTRCIGWPLEMARVGIGYGFIPEPDDPNLHSRHHCSLDGLFAVDWEESCSSLEASGRALRPKGPTTDNRGGSCLTPEQLAEHASSWRQHLRLLVKDQPEERRAQLTRGCEVKITALWPRSADHDSYDDLHDVADDPDERAFDEAVRESLSRAEQEQERLFANLSIATPEAELPEALRLEFAAAREAAAERIARGQTRRELLSVSWSDVDVLSQLIAFQTKLLEAGAEPADFRVMIAFDN